MDVELHTSNRIHKSRNTPKQFVAQAKMKFMNSIVSPLSLLSMILCLYGGIRKVEAGPIMAGSAVAACYTACNAGYVTCLAGSGLVAGMTGPVGWYAWITGAATGCSAVQAACMSACTAGGLAASHTPTP